MTWEQALRWTEEGTELFDRALQRVTDPHLDGPTLLPHWSCRHLIAHVAANADALGNLVHWAATGEERPMYVSAEQRNADIESGSAKDLADLRSWVVSSAGRLRDGLAGLNDQQWQHRVRTAQGREVPATEIPWMRAREVMVHSVDLDVDILFDDLPVEFLAALVLDIVGKRTAQADGPPLSVVATDIDQSWSIPGGGDSVRIDGRLADVAGWLAGRTTRGVSSDNGALPALPRWL